MISLGALMFLQYAIWGSWVPVAQTYFMGAQPAGIGLQSTQLGIIFAIMPLCSLLISPIFGNLADRVFNGEKILAVLHLCSAAAMFLVSKQETFSGVLACLVLHCFFFAPTVALSNSVVLANLSDPAGQFSKIRLFGTMGWLCSGALLTLLRSSGASLPRADLFVQASLLGVVLGFVCFLLPKTPPSAISKEKFAFGKAISLMKEPKFMIFMIFGFVVSTQFDFYYLCTSGFLTAPTIQTLSQAMPKSILGYAGKGLGLPVKDISLIMSLAQASEVFMMLLLPGLLRKLGMKWTLSIGLFAWFLRYAIFTFVPVKAAVIPALMLHGPSFACFFVAGAIFVEQVAPSEIRSSAQSLFNMATFGIGRILGSLLAGNFQAQNTYKLPAKLSVGGGEIESVVQWQALFAVPTGITLACALLFPILFSMSFSKIQNENKSS